MDPKQRVEALEALSQEVEALHNRAIDLLSGSPDAREATILARLGEARRTLGEHLPFARDTAATAKERREMVTNYLGRKYGRALRQG